MSTRPATLPIEPVVEVELHPTGRNTVPSSLPAVSTSERPADQLLVTIERLVTGNPTVAVDVIERVIAAHERIVAFNAKSAFNEAFSRMQPELPQIAERGQIKVRGELRSTYAKLEDIHTAIMPVLKAHGFAIRHRTEWPADKPGIIRIVGILSHAQGHSEESSFEAPMDKSDYRTDIQSQGSTVSYGRRYTTLDLLNIATRGVDDDGQTGKRPELPANYQEWIAEMRDASMQGTKALMDKWNASDQTLRRYLNQHDKAEWQRLRDAASQVKA